MRKLMKRPFWGLRIRWEDNIKIYLKKIGCEGVDWIHLVQDRDKWRAPVNTFMNFRVP
jgi:hypothetical protein